MYTGIFKKRVFLLPVHTSTVKKISLSTCQRKTHCQGRHSSGRTISFSKLAQKQGPKPDDIGGEVMQVFVLNVASSNKDDKGAHSDLARQKLSFPRLHVNT